MIFFFRLYLNELVGLMKIVVLVHKNCWDIFTFKNKEYWN